MLHTQEDADFSKALPVYIFKQLNAELERASYQKYC